MDGFSLEHRVEEGSLNSRRFREDDVAAAYRIPSPVAWVPLEEIVMSHSQPRFSNQHNSIFLFPMILQERFSRIF